MPFDSDLTSKQSNTQRVGNKNEQKYGAYYASTLPPMGLLFLLFFVTY